MSLKPGLRALLMRLAVAAAAAAVLAVGMALQPATAADARVLRVALAVEPTSLDPHVNVTAANAALSQHIFDRLIHSDDKQQLVAGLAVAWTAIDALTWEFKLRAGVTWHDGAPFTADDVVFSLTRASAADDSPLRGAKVSQRDDLVVRIASREANPLLPHDLTVIAVVSRKHGAAASTADYNSGKAAIGTGPYKFAAFVPGERIELAGNASYWGAAPAWSRVVFKTLKSGGARIAALLADEADIIEDLPINDIARLKTDPRISVAQTISHRVVYLQMDQWRETTPFANAKTGAAIKNPFRDRRVRRAIAQAIDREAIVARVMDGNAVIATQMLADVFFGVARGVKPLPFDPEAAKKLLAEAGLQGGFKVTLHGPNGRYPNDARILEAIAAMLTRIGIEATIEALPPSAFLNRAASGADGNPEFSLFLGGWAAITGENSSPLKALIASYDTDKGTGMLNRGRYASKAFDDALDGALKATDLELLRTGLGKATDVAIADQALIPIVYPLNTWAARKGLTVTPRTDEATTAMMVAPAAP